MYEMDNSRPSSPDAPPQDLWSSILDSVSASRSTPSKQIILLGEPSSGKSTLASALLQKPPPDETKEDQRIDFAIGYNWADVRDDADEGAGAQAQHVQKRPTILPTCRYPRTTVRIYRAVLSSLIHCIVTPLRSSPERSPSYPCSSCAGLDPTVVIHPRTRDLAGVGGEMGQRGWFSRA